METALEPSDVLLTRIACGQAAEDDWRQLIERHSSHMRRAAALGGEAGSEDDAVQEALIQLRRCAGRFRRGDGNAEVEVRRWLQGVAMNCALGLRRAAVRRRRREAAIARPAHSAELSSDIDDKLADALARLDAEERRLLVLRHVEGLDHAALAAAIGISEASARKRLSRIHQRLRARLARSRNVSIAIVCAALDSAAQRPVATGPLAIPAAIASPSLPAAVALGSGPHVTVIALAGAASLALFALACVLAVVVTRLYRQEVLPRTTTPATVAGLTEAVGPAIAAAFAATFHYPDTVLTFEQPRGGQQSSPVAKCYAQVANGAPQGVWIGATQWSDDPDGPTLECRFIGAAADGDHYEFRYTARGSHDAQSCTVVFSGTDCTLSWPEGLTARLAAPASQE